MKETRTYDLDPESFGGTDFPDWEPHSDPLQELSAELRKTEPAVPTRTIKTGPKDIMGPLVTPEEQSVINKFYEDNPQLKQSPVLSVWEQGSMRFNQEDAWIQTYSGRRFNPTNPYVDAIVIQDISHSLSMQCRFSGHVRRFYSVAQHSVLVSYICNQEDALWGLMHDASEAYLVDVPRPLKRSGKFDTYLEFEDRMQRAICKRFGLPEKEPPSVKKADQILLATEARDLMAPLRSDWVQPCEPLPFKIDPLPQQEAKNMFMKRFFDLTGNTGGYAHYLSYENKS
jgi:5'-deoxynucleotidase YfbR-like HD superfamily hydrolase